MADISISWKKITRGLPRGKKFADDRIPTLPVLKKLIDYPDRRIKAIVWTMASSGVRVGFWDYLRWSHIKPIEKDGEVIAAKMIVYAGEDDEYFTFISPKAPAYISILQQGKLLSLFQSSSTSTKKFLKRPGYFILKYSFWIKIH